MQFERIVESGQGKNQKPKILMRTDLPEGGVSGHLVNGRGPGLTEAEGIGVLLSPRPAEMAAFLAGELSAEDMLEMHQNGAGRINTAVSGTAELVTGYNDDGQIEIAGRLKNSEFVEHDTPRGVKVGEFLGAASEIVN